MDMKIENTLSVGFNTVSGGYMRIPLIPPNTILKVKEWKRRHDYDLIIKESYAKASESWKVNKIPQQRHSDKSQ